MGKKILVRLKKSTAIGLVAFSLALAPPPAMALQSLISIALSTLAKYLQDVQETIARNAAIIQSTISQMYGKQSSIESLLAVGDKTSASKKELTQAKINYQAAQESNIRYTTAVDTFTSQSSQTPNVCAIMGSTRVGIEMSDDSDASGKALTRVVTRNRLTYDNAQKSADMALANYRSNYCSTEDVKRGFCDSPAPANMQGAALNASTLLSPESGETYTAQEAKAAQDFVQMAVNPVPVQMLPKALENSVGGERFQLAAMNKQAQLSSALASFSHIFSNRSAKGTGAKEGVSVVGLMKGIVGENFGNSNTAAKIAGTNEKAMYELLNLHLADMNWMDYQTYRQGEHIELAVAVQLASQVKEQGDRQIGALRSMLSTR